MDKVKKPCNPNDEDLCNTTLRSTMATVDAFETCFYHVNLRAIS